MRCSLNGCRPEPFSSYLKSLAVIRLVGEQKDPKATGIWTRDNMMIESSLDREGLVDFFLNEYSPTPIVSPWNGGSGFYHGDDNKGLNAILSDTSRRFDPYRRTIKEIQSWPELPRTDLTIDEIMHQLSTYAEKLKGKKRLELLNLVSKTGEAMSRIDTLFMNAKIVECTIEQFKGEIAKIGKTPRRPEDEDPVKESKNLVKKINTEFKNKVRISNKPKIIRACRNRLDQRVVEWIDTAVLIDPDGELKFPPILGRYGIKIVLDYFCDSYLCFPLIQTFF